VVVVYSWIVAHSPAQLCVTSSRRLTWSRGVSSASGGIVQLPHASNFETHRSPTGARLVVMESPWRQFEPSAIFSSSTSFALDDDCSTKSLQGGRVSVCPLLLHLNATKIGHAQLRSWPRPIGITCLDIRLGLHPSWAEAILQDNTAGRCSETCVWGWPTVWTAINMRAARHKSDKGLDQKQQVNIRDSR
jgi:hypothetical protein